MTTIHSPAQRAGFMRVPALALAGALLVSGFALGQIAPNLVEMIGPLDSARTEAVAPALTTADDYATRQGAIAPALTTADDYATRHRER